jgi:membrane associated rhomboid family serine protease
MDRTAGGSQVTPDQEPSPSEETEYCYGHPKTPTKLHCSRCDRPICGRCAIPASVGQHCPECVAEARKSAPKVRSAMTATAPVVTAILGINIVVYIAQQLLGFSFTDRFVMDPFLIRSGEYWRLITPVFLHAHVFHILMNCYVLYALGPNVEQSFGKVRFALMYLAAGFFGNVMSFVIPPDARSLGASGAVFGMAGVLLIYLYRRRRSAFVAQYLRSILFFIGINLAIGFVFRGIDNWAHIGGLLSGVVLGFGFDREDQLKPITQVVSMLVVLGVGVFLVLTRL